ncbi:retinoid- and fatty-acid binding glycoprotein apolipophorin [Nomia melanderi]|uniref:retinoid- and fatty-acid binding glycoprotein apolipophorin n=1 Tax=Nomia melanderi TaxID=2448451 RepID=UPI0013041628|nr:apolipophorins [Nomia melanderi]
MGHPPRLLATTLACLFLLFATAESAAKCSTGCRGMNPVKAYQEGHTYVYNLDGLSVTSVTEAQGDATLKVSATVEMSVKPDCIHQIRLKNVQLNGAPPSTPDVEQYAVQFNYHGGHIDTEICAEPGDSQASLNIKRAVVSLFQSAVMQESGSTTHHETDVMGACPTDFTFRKEGESLIVQKNRNLARCAFRENLNQGLITASVDTAAGIRTSPILASEQDIEQRFKQGILTKAMSKETYKLRPFSNGDAGAKTEVETTLTLKNDKSTTPKGAQPSVPKTLIFEAPHPVVKSSVDAISKALKAAKAEVDGGVKQDAAGKFSELVKVLRVSSKDDILSVYQKVRAGAGFDKNDLTLLLDGLFRAASGEVAEVGVELVKNKELNSIQTLFFYTSLALVQHVNLPSVAAVTSLLDQPNLPRIGYLGVGQVIGKYCQAHSCENVPEVKEAVHKIREKVGNGKAKTREQEDLVISALKALGNTQFIDDATLQKLANIGADKNVKNRVRVAAIEALPTRCSMKWKNIMFKVLADREEDAEIRIKTYLSLVACPCPHVANQLKETLDKETVNQVGSFIQSHLRNLRASTDPNKLNAKNHLGLIKPRTKFPEDFRKFSFNDEMSYKIDAYGLGSTVEENVIYSQNSFVPRSAGLNVTMELFGNSFNLLDFNARVENLDRVIEHWLGPKGKLWANRDFKELKEEGAAAANTIGNYIKERYQKTVRGKREVKQGELDRFAKNVRLRGNEVDQNVDVDLSLKLFGVELAYLSCASDPDKLNPEAIIDKIFDRFDKGIDLVKNLNYDLENYMQFLEADLVYPTNLGTALSLGLIGTSAARVKTNGKLDLPAILRNPEKASLKVGVEPSVSVRLVSQMVVQGLGAEAGMKVVSTVHTATSSELSVNMLDGKGVDVYFSVPKKEQELINVESEVLMGSQGKYEPAKFSEGTTHKDCFEQFSTILGVTVCGEISLPYKDLASAQQRPMFPLSGPAKFAVSLENNDVSAYHFKVYLNVDDPKKRSFEILLETPKSKTNRRVALNVDVGTEPNWYAKVAFDSPIKRASAEAVLKNNAQERSLSVTAVHDQMNYYARVGLLSSGGKYKPVLEYKFPEHLAKLAGVTPGSQGGQQYNIQGTVDVSDHEGGQKFVMEKLALLVGGKEHLVVDGSLAWTPTNVKIDAKLGYADKSLDLKVDGKATPGKNFALAVTAVPSTDPNIGFSLDWNFALEKNSMENKLVFVHGPDPKSEVNRLTLEQSATYKIDPVDLILATENELKYAPLNLKLKLDGKVASKSVSGDVEVSYEKFKIGGELSAKVDMKTPGDYELELEAELMQNSVELKSKRTVLEPHKSKFENSLVLSPGGKYSADTTVTYDVSKNNVNVQLDGDANLDGKKVKVDTGLEANPQAVNSRALVKMNGVKYLEFTLTAKKTPNPSGNMDLNVKNYLMANGQFSYQNGKGNMNLNVDVPKINRKIEATGQLKVRGMERVGSVEVLYDAGKDRNKKLKLSTTTVVKKNSVDSSNLLELNDQKLQVNGKGSLHGTFNEGYLQLDLDVTLPNGRLVTYKVKRNATKEDKNCGITVNAELGDSEQKDGPTRKLQYDAIIMSVCKDPLEFESVLTLKMIDTEGKDIAGTLKLKNLKTENIKENGISVQLEGAKVPKKFQWTVHTYRGDEDLEYNTDAAWGDDLKMASKGSINRGDSVDKPCKADILVDMKLPSKTLSDLKFAFNRETLLAFEKEVLRDTTSMNLMYNKDKVWKMEDDWRVSGLSIPDKPSEGKAALTINILDYPQWKLDGNYKYHPTDEKKTADVDLKGYYGDQKFELQSNNVYLPDTSTVKMNIKSVLPMEKLRNVEMQVDYKRDKPENKITTDVVVTADGTKYTLNSGVQRQETSGHFFAILTTPQDKTEVSGKFQRLSPKEYKGEWKISTPKGFVVADVQADLDDAENFMIEANFDSDKIKQRKIHASIANKPTGKAEKRILITVTSDGKNIVTGSTSYKKREEDGKIVVEGNGNLQVGDNTRSSSFKYTRQQLTREKDGEVGVAMILNANFGPSAIVGELKLTNKELHVFNSYCEQNKDCAHFKLQSTLDLQPEKPSLKHQITVEVDLKKFNVPAEFGLKTNTDYKQLLLDHTTNLYLHSSKDKSEYTYQLYVHPKDAASILTLPSRELAVTATYDLPKTKYTGAYKLDLSVYLDRKNKPSDKTSLTAVGDVNIVKNSVALHGETKFSYPTQPKNMVVKGTLNVGEERLLHANLEVDVFEKKAQKISITADVQRHPIGGGNNVTSDIQVHSVGQKLKLSLNSWAAYSDKEVGASSYFTYNDVHQKPKSLGGLARANWNGADLLLTLPDQELIREQWKIDVSKDAVNILGELSLLGEPAEVLKFESKGLNSFKATMYRQDNPKEKVVVNGQLVLGQLAEVHANMYEDSAKKELFRVLLHLDEKQFLKPDFSYDKENLMKVWKDEEKRASELKKKSSEVGERAMKHLTEETGDLTQHLKKAQPNLQPLLDYYQGELKKLEQEISADETVKAIEATLKHYFGGIASVIHKAMKSLAESLQQLQKRLNDMLNNLKEEWKSVYPVLQTYYQKIFEQFMEILEALAKLGKACLEALLDLINSYQKELQDVMSVISSLTQDLSKTVTKILEKLKGDIDEFTSMLSNQLKALSIYDMAKERYEQLKNWEVPEYLLGTVKEICNLLKNSAPTMEVRLLVEATCEYFGKLLKQEKVDTTAELKKLYSLAVPAIRSVISAVQKQVTWGDVPVGGSVRIPSLLDLSLLSKLPGIFTLRVSAMNLLRNGELPTLLDLYYTYRPTRHLSDLVPPFSKVGIVTDGGHFFTFDGRHMTMPGTCTYILAQDMQDGNFSIVANFNEGNLISVTITEPKESITLKNNGNILVNNKPADFPASTKNLHAYLVPPFASVKSDYGARISCSDEKPMICAVHVSGFYLAKLRGLFGDGNNEPYDDFTLPSGKITDSASDFGNAYKLKDDCPAATAVHHKDRAPVCTDYFASQSSPLKSCFNYVNPSSYRDACDHAVAANTAGGACLIATAYHYTCYEAGLLSTTIPAACGNCKAGAATVDIGDAFSVKIPKKEADIVIVVEQVQPNEKIIKDMVTPLITELRDELKQQGMTDVRVGLIGFADKMKWPQHYTLNGDTNINGEVKNMKFYEKTPTVSFEETEKAILDMDITQESITNSLQYLRQKLDVELGTMKLTDAYQEAVRYPFRPAAAKAVIGVHTNICEKSPLPISLQQIRLLLGLKTYRDLGLTYYHMFYPKELLVSGKPQKNIVGYDQDSAYTFADSKKKPLTGSTDMKNDLTVSTTDVCADFAVSTGGAMFSLDNFLDAKPHQKKQFIQVAARRVADGLANLELEKDCSCEYQYGVIGRSQCKIVGRKDKELARHSKGGVRG